METVRSPAVWMVLVAAFLDMLGMGIVMPVLPQLVAELTGSFAAAGLWTGVIGSLWGFMQFICAPIIGALSDRFGRRPVILISTAGLVADWVLMAVAPSIWWLVIGRFLGGMTSASSTALLAYMTDITPAKNRAAAFGLVGAAMAAGFVVGPVLGGILGGVFPRLPFWVAAGLSAGAFIFGIVVLKESLPPERRKPFTWRTAHAGAALGMLATRPGLVRLSLSFFLLTFSHRLIMTILVLFVGHQHGMSTFEIGGLLTFFSVLDVSMQGAAVGPVTARFGDRPTTVIGLLAGALSFLGMGLAPNAAWFVAATVPASLMSLAEPTLKSMLSARAPEGEQGQLQGAMQSLGSIAGIAGPVFFGWTYGVTSDTFPGLTFFIGAGILAVAATCILDDKPHAKSPKSSSRGE